MNEAIELSKKYEDEDSPAYVNGVVNAIYKGLKK
jgi:transcription termination factor NusB